MLGSIGCALPIQAHEEEIRCIAHDKASDMSIIYWHSWVKEAAVLDLRPWCTDIWFIARSPLYTTLETALTDVARRSLEEKELRGVDREGAHYRDEQKGHGKIRSYTISLLRKGSGHASRCMMVDEGKEHTSKRRR